ncbi:MAG: PAS domain S-box protein [Hyphomonas sp.]
MSEHETFFLNHPDPMWILDPASRHFLDVNPAATSLYGFSREEFLQMSLADIAPETGEGAEAAAPREAEWHLLRSGEKILVSVRSRSFNLAGRPATLFAVRDVTEIAGEKPHRQMNSETGAPYGAEPVGESLTAAYDRLQEHEANLRIAQRLLKIGFWKYEIDSERLVWSPSVYEMAGITPDEFDGRFSSYVDALHKDDKAQAAEAGDRLKSLSSDITQFERRLTRPDGRMVHIKGVGEMTTTASGKVVTGVVQDVTEEREQEGQLRLLETAVERLNDIVLIVEIDPDLPSTDAPIVYVNTVFERLTGFRRDQVIGRALSFALGRVTPALTSEEMRSVLGTGGSLRRELTGPVKGGRTIIWDAEFLPVADLAGRITHWVAVARDITERRLAEKRAEMAEDRFRLVSRATDDVVWDWDVIADTFWWSAAFARLTGDSGAPLETDFSLWSRRVHPDDRERVVSTLRAAVATPGATSWTEEYRFVRKDGSERSILDRGFLIRDDAGTVTRMVGTMMDITERRAAEQRARDSDRMEAVGELTGGVAHDFNNLLTVILGNSDLLKERIEDPALRRMAELVHLAASRGSDLTRRLLAFARRQPLKPQEICLNDRTASIHALLRGALDARIRVRHQAAGDLWKVLLDPGQFDVALLNLAFNARDAMPDGGELMISTANVTVRGRADPAGVPAGHYVCVTVKDTGGGMSPETQRRAFEPFFTTKPPGKGSGLGLSMVYGFVGQSMGHVVIRSVPGEGTAVHLYFPRSTQVARASTAAPRQDPAAAPLQSGRVLIVEDDPLVREHAARNMQEVGFDVVLAASAEDALSALKVHPDISLLFTDIILGAGMDGASLAQEARRMCPGIRVLYTSGYVPGDLGAESPLEPGAVLLGKPYERDQLMRTLSRVLSAPPDQPA